MKRVADLELSVVIVNYNTRDLILECLDSIRKYPPKLAYEVIVVDNGSTDGSVEMLSKDRGIRFISNSQNLGFAKANNQGIRAARGRCILLLNSDTKVTDGAIEKMVGFASRTPDAGAVAARLLDLDGSIQPSAFHFPTIWRAVRQYWFGEKGLLDKFAPLTDEPVEVEIATMAAFLISPAALAKVGPLDERYFFYFEDLDYCRRLARVGLKVYYLPDAKVYHYHGASGRKLRDRDDQWRRLIPSSKIYHGVVGHYIFNFILWSAQKWQRIFGGLV